MKKIEIEPKAFKSITFNENICNGCNVCVEVCQVDLFIPNPEKGKPPILLFPEECWFDGSCVEVCPKPGAIKLNNLPRNKVHWKRKETGEDFWL
jgi:NAD-dependent dihydropyrimidine dehydrogenase PreA subunit